MKAKNRMKIHESLFQHRRSDLALIEQPNAQNPSLTSRNYLREMLTARHLECEGHFSMVKAVNKICQNISESGKNFKTCVKWSYGGCGETWKIKSDDLLQHDNIL